MTSNKVLIIGVGNSGTSLLGKLIHELMTLQGLPVYFYEPLYWSGTNGKANIVLNHAGIQEHTTFPLLPDPSVPNWPWMDRFIEDLHGMAKFIRAGSRVRLFVDRPVKIVWIVRELYWYLASMQKNFPRCGTTAGWHHRPGEYDDYERIKPLFPGLDLVSGEEWRVEVEAAWWYIHNLELKKQQHRQNVLRLRYEDLCLNPMTEMKRVCDFLALPFTASATLSDVRPKPLRKVQLSGRNIRMIERIAGDLNRELYADGELNQLCG